MQDLENIVYPVKLEDGYVVEAVYYGTGTLCISVQAGCAVGCGFCASGKKGLKRNLAFEEMKLQVNRCIEDGITPERITVSGIGEPLHNFENLKLFIEYCRECGLKVSVTTTGSPVKKLDELLSLSHNGVMLSLHAGTQETHKKLIPFGADFSDLKNYLINTVSKMSRGRRRLFGINYLLLEGVNDNTDDIEGVAEIAEKLQYSTLHLLVCNQVENSSYKSPGSEFIDNAYEFFRAKKINCRRAGRFRKHRKGACGTLYLRELESGL